MRRWSCSGPNPSAVPPTQLLVSFWTYFSEVELQWGLSPSAVPRLRFGFRLDGSSEVELQWVLHPVLSLVYGFGARLERFTEVEMQWDSSPSVVPLSPAAAYDSRLLWPRSRKPLLRTQRFSPSTDWCTSSKMPEASFMNREGQHALNAC